MLRYVHKDSNGILLRRSWADAWKDYRCHHVVSKWAARIIHQFNASHLADSLEAAENEDEISNRIRHPIDNSWMRLSAVHAILQGTDSAERRRSGKDDDVTLSAHAHQIEAAKAITEDLWKVDTSSSDTITISAKRDSIEPAPGIGPSKKQGAESTKTASLSVDKASKLLYKDFSSDAAREWTEKLKAGRDGKKPSQEQLDCIHAIVERCTIEAIETDTNPEYRSEPLRMILHGVPGASR